MSNLVSITIDGKKISAPRGSNLLQIARDNGVEIPYLCYHKKLSPTGACRLCIVKIKGINGFVASCTVKISDGMEVIAFDADLEEARKYLLDYLLAEHNETYDGTYYDEFRDLVLRYGLDDPQKRLFPSMLNHLDYPVDESSPVLTYDASKCIKCFRCIKACEEVQGKSVLSFSERGISSYIIAGNGVWGKSECDGCGECIQLCPTGAIVEKPHRDKINIQQKLSKVMTTCPYCGVGCQLEVWVQNGQIVRSNGVEGVSPNDGRLCVKGRFGYDYVHHSDRLKKPLIRKNGVLVESDWDEALDLIASRFNEIKQKYGPDALAGYTSAKCTNEDNYIFMKFVRTVFGTNNIDYCTRLCHASTVTAMLRALGDGAGSNSIEDYEHSDCVLVAGNNMIETHPVTATFVKAGKTKGGKIIIIDPKWTPLVKYADIWLQPKLGTDVALLNAMIHVVVKEQLFDVDFIEKRVDGGMKAFEELQLLVEKYTPEYASEITGVEASLISEAARTYARAKRPLIATGMGFSQQVTGTHNVFCLINLCLITGQIGKIGAGINPPRGQNNVQGASDVGAAPMIYPGYIPVGNDENRRRVAEIWGVPYESLSAKPGLTTVEIMQAAYDGRVKGLYVMGENPMITDPNLNHTREAIEKLDFLVVQDIFPTETTALAHVVLPASSFAEKNGTFVNSDRRVSRVRKLVELPGEAREDWRIVCEIARRMGSPLPEYVDEAQIFEEIGKAAPIFAGINYTRIEKEGIQWPCPDTAHPGTSTLFLEKFNTPNGLGKLHPVEYVPQNEKVCNEYPFLLNSGRILYHYHSATMSRRNKALTDFIDKPYVLMNPLDAQKGGFWDGQKVQLTSRRGSLTTHIIISDQVLSGELFMPFHFNEAPVNNLTRDELDPYSKIAPFKLSACRVVPSE